uniref:Uncharacterized protein n=1 Tax=Poecilia reticulata TaxID=8081 RepID=A0A3P9P7X2_POERE
VDGKEVSFWNVKYCASHHWCVETSVAYGNMREIYNATCCQENQCNTQILPFPMEINPYMSAPNGKKCFTCEGDDCRKPLNCHGIENYCFTQSKMLKGCASKRMCLKSNVDGTYTNFDCCETLNQNVHFTVDFLLLFPTF